MTTTARPLTADIHIARDELMHYLLALAAHTRRISRIYNDQGRPVAQLDNKKPPYKLEWTLTSLYEYGLIEFDRAKGTTEREIAQTTALGDITLGRWEKQLFRGTGTR